MSSGCGERRGMLGWELSLRSLEGIRAVVGTLERTARVQV